MAFQQCRHVLFHLCAVVCLALKCSDLDLRGYQSSGIVSSLSYLFGLFMWQLRIWIQFARQKAVNISLLDLKVAWVSYPEPFE